MTHIGGLHDIMTGSVLLTAGEVKEVEDRIDQLQVENAKLRELAVGMYGMLEMFDTLLGNHDACETPRPLVFGEDKSFKDAMRELGLVGE